MMTADSLKDGSNLTKNDASPKSKDKVEQSQSKARKQNVDRGWSWVILIACFLSNMILVGYFKAFGLFFVEFRREFNAPATVTSLVIGLHSAVYSISALFVLNVVVQRFSVRAVTLTGVLISSSAVILSYFAMNVEFMIFTHSFLLGVGNAMIYGPGMVILGKYFDKRRALATAIACSGVSSGSIIVPPLLRFFIDEYGMRGAFLIMGAIVFNMAISACLYRPFPGSEIGQSEKTNEPTVQKTINASVTKRSLNHCSDDVVNQRLVVTRVSEQRPYQRNRNESYIERGNNESNKVVSKNSSKERDEAVGLNFQTYLEVENQADCSVNINQKDGEREIHLVPENDQRPEHRALASGTESMTRSSSVIRYTSNQDLIYASTSTLPHNATSVQDKYHEEWHSNSKQENCLAKIKYLLDFSLFKNQLFLVISGMTMFGVVGGALPNAYIPPLAAEKGLSDVQAALLLSIIAGLDLISRLLSGCIAELRFIKRHHMIIVAFFVLAVTFQFTAFYNSFEVIIIFIIFYGTFGGVYFSLMPVVVTDFLGIGNFAKAFGFVQLFQGVGAAASYPVLGALRDATGSYTSTFHLLGAYALFTALILLMEPLARRNMKRREKDKLNVEMHSLTSVAREQEHSDS